MYVYNGLKLHFNSLKHTFFFYVYDPRTLSDGPIENAIILLDTVIETGKTSGVIFKDQRFNDDGCTDNALCRLLDRITRMRYNYRMWALKKINGGHAFAKILTNSI